MEKQASFFSKIIGSVEVKLSIRAVVTILTCGTKIKLQVVACS